MKRILTVVLALALVGYLGCGANAAEMVKEGAQRLAIVGSADYGSIYGDDDAHNMNFSVSAEYGYMVLDQLELAVRGTFALDSYRYSTPDEGSYSYRSQNYALDLVPKWRPAVEGNISPFIGPKVGVRYVTNSDAYGYVSGSGSRDSANDAVIEWGAVLGVDIFLAKNIALVVEYDYTQYTVHTGFEDSLGVPISTFGANGYGWSGHLTVKDNALTAGLAYWW
jgi:opacity protein-like surface antigen